MSRVLLKNVVKKYGDVTAVHELNLEVQDGEFLTLLGPSGCGKTTTLRLIAGFISPNQGTIFLGDHDVTQVAPQHREIGMVFQDYALFPHMTIFENIEFGLKERRYDKKSIQPRVEELLELIRLPEVANRYPAEVSGGQQQRIAVARAVAYPPQVLLMDEPLGALDLKLRETMQVELRRIQKELQITTVYVTHDQTEAMNMSDRIVVMNDGRIQQMGTAQDIYNKPDTRFVADFVGQINLLDGRIISESVNRYTVETLFGQFEVPRASSRIDMNQEVSIGIRPESLVVAGDAGDMSARNEIGGEIVAKTFAGNLAKVVIDIGSEKQFVLESRPGEIQGEVGEKIIVTWESDIVIVLMK